MPCFPKYNKFEIGEIAHVYDQNWKFQKNWSQRNDKSTTPIF